jgi:hypothetical protein
VLTFLISSNASARSFHGVRVNDDTILKRALPPYLTSLPTILVSLGGEKDHSDNLVGIGCDNGSFYILSPGTDRFFMSHQQVASGPLQSVIPVISGRHNDSYYMISASDSFHIVHWDGSILHIEKHYDAKQQLELIQGISLREVFGFSGHSIYRLTIDWNENFKISQERLFASRDSILNVKYSRAQNRLLCRTANELIIIDPMQSPSTEHAVTELPRSSPRSRESLSPFVAERWAASIPTIFSTSSRTPFSIFRRSIRLRILPGSFASSSFSMQGAYSMNGASSSLERLTITSSKAMISSWVLET